MKLATLILGGHSFIAQLGRDPKPDQAQIDALVAACLNAGISRFDTTYRPERIALGASLQRLGRRAEARLIAWNFFEMFDDQAPVGGPQALREEHIDAITADLQTGFLDELVVHGVADAGENERQEILALAWKNSGRVGRLGLWSPGEVVQNRARVAEFDFVVEPTHVFAVQAPERVLSYHALGLEIYGCSPFVRGWEMEKLVALALARGETDEQNIAKMRAKLADHLLRHALFVPHVSQLIVAMRRAQWVEPNLESARRGPLSPAESAWLRDLCAAC